jgi:1,4-dihydroxy-2-naphthoyl-CoA hydrolase
MRPCLADDWGPGKRLPKRNRVTKKADNADVADAGVMLKDVGGWSDQIGLEVIEVGPERVVAQVEAHPRHHQPYGIMHGGVYCSIVEGVASIGAGNLARINGQAGVVGVANSTDFLRSHSVGGLVATGVPVHQGKSAQLWSVEIRRTSDQKLVSRGQVRFHILTELPDQRGT